MVTSESQCRAVSERRSRLSARSAGRSLGLVLVIALVFLMMTGSTIWSTAVGAPIEGRIVKVANGEVVVDLGRHEGLGSNARVQVLRRLEVEHPVTGKVIEDRFPIGVMTLNQVGELLSIATSVDGLERIPAAGDYIVFNPPLSGAPDAVPATSPTAPPPERDPEVLAAQTLFEDALGRPLDERIRLYERFLETHEDSVYRPAIERELVALSNVLSEYEGLIDEARVSQLATAEAMAPEPLTVRVAVPAKTRVAVAPAIHVSVREVDEVATVRLFTRPAGAKQYDEWPFVRHGDFNWIASFPDDLVEKPGEIEYFVEVVTADGRLLAHAGHSGGPSELAVVAETPDHPDTRKRSTLTSVFEYVDFWAGGGTDAFFRFETDFRYLIDWGIVRAFSMGVGVFQGEGGSVKGLESSTETPRSRDVNYGYSELEFEFHEWFGVRARLSAGNHHQTDDGRAEGVVGFGGDFRIGTAEGTRLLLGGSLTQQIGNEGWIRLFLNEVPSVPMDVAVVVTNLPVDADLGVSIDYGAGYQFNEYFALSARLGFNARTINHYGFTGGAGTVVTW